MASQLAQDSGTLIGGEVGYMRSVIIIRLIVQISEEATKCLGHTLRLGKLNSLTMSHRQHCLLQVSAFLLRLV